MLKRTIPVARRHNTGEKRGNRKKVTSAKKLEGYSTFP